MFENSLDLLKAPALSFDHEIRHHLESRSWVDDLIERYAEPMAREPQVACEVDLREKKI